MASFCRFYAGKLLVTSDSWYTMLASVCLSLYLSVWLSMPCKPVSLSSRNSKKGLYWGPAYKAAVTVITSLKSRLKCHNVNTWSKWQWMHQQECCYFSPHTQLASCFSPSIICIELSFGPVSYFTSVIPHCRDMPHSHSSSEIEWPSSSTSSKRRASSDLSANMNGVLSNKSVSCAIFHTKCRFVFCDAEL